MFKFLLSSMGSTLIDLGVFYLVMKLFGAGLGAYRELVSTAVARACSSFANFSANNAVVFENRKHYKRALVRYYCLCIPQMLVSAGLVTLINHLLANSVPYTCHACQVRCRYLPFLHQLRYPARVGVHSEGLIPT